MSTMLKTIPNLTSRTFGDFMSSLNLKAVVNTTSNIKKTNGRGWSKKRL